MATGVRREVEEEDQGVRIWNGITLPENIEVRDDVLSIRFRYKGHRPRETLGPASKGLIKDAALKLASVLYDIKCGEFKYYEHFPNSQWCVKLGEINSVGRTFTDAADDYIAWKRKRVAESSYVVEEREVKAFKRLWGARLVTAITVNDVAEVCEDWTEHTDEGTGVVMKTVRNRMTIASNIFNREIKRGTITANPVRSTVLRDEVSKAALDYEKPDADPFTGEERELLTQPYDPAWRDKNCRGKTAARVKQGHTQFQNLIPFVCGTGLRAEEWVALKWEDFDWVNNTVFVRRHINSRGTAINYVTKSKGGNRVVGLTADVCDVLGALDRQKKLTGKLLEGWVFVNFQKPVLTRFHKACTISNSQWDTLLGSTGVRHRGPNQMRHTYASERITRGDSQWEIAQEMGHKGTGMLEKHYGKLMKVVLNRQRDEAVAAEKKAKRARTGLKLVG